METTDPTKYRVTYICKCSADYAEGYGNTPEEAEGKVKEFWKIGGHKIADIASRIVEIAVMHGNGGSHYEEVT